MKKLTAILLITVMLFAMTACGSGPSKSEKLFIDKAQQMLDEENFDGAKAIIDEGLSQKPESEYLKEMSIKIAEAKLAAIPPVPSDTEVKTRFIEFHRLCEKWFGLNSDISYSDAIYKQNGEYEWSHLVTEEGIRTKADLDELFLSYCTYDMYKSLSAPLSFYQDINGKLCITFELGGIESTEATDEGSVTITKVTSEDFAISYYKYEYEGGEASVYKCDCIYARDEDSKYKFGTITEELVSANYEEDYELTSANNSGIEVKEFARAASNTKTISKPGTKVKTACGFNDWYYIYSEDHTIEGWVETKSVKAKTEEKKKSSNYYGGTTVGDLVDAGISVAGAVLNNFF